jgi:hypothetical protein
LTLVTVNSSDVVDAVISDIFLSVGGESLRVEGVAQKHCQGGCNIEDECGGLGEPRLVLCLDAV